jgi:hypothetical protein
MDTIINHAASLFTLTPDARRIIILSIVCFAALC